MWTSEHTPHFRHYLFNNYVNRGRKVIKKKKKSEIYEEKTRSGNLRGVSLVSERFIKSLSTSMLEDTISNMSLPWKIPQGSRSKCSWSILEKQKNTVNYSVLNTTESPMSTNSIQWVPILLWDNHWRSPPNMSSLSMQSCRSCG